VHLHIYVKSSPYDDFLVYRYSTSQGRETLSSDEERRGTLASVVVIEIKSTHHHDNSLIPHRV